jgi:hypothetical protein
MRTVETIHLGRLGKRMPRIDTRTLRLANYLTATQPIVPAVVNWLSKVKPLGMMLNDILGDCTTAAAGHMIELWTANAGSKMIPPDKAIRKAYEVAGGYVNGDPSTDNGAFMIDVLNYWRQIGIAGHQIVAFVAVDPRNTDEWKRAIYLFGAIYMGVQLPISIQGASSWTVPASGAIGDGAPGSWGGHCVPVGSDDGVEQTVITWGEDMPMSPQFPLVYSDEAYAIISHDWIEKNGNAPNGIDLPHLMADLKQVTA